MKKKFTTQEKTRIVLEFLGTSTGVAELCRKYNLAPPTLYQWKDKFIQNGKLGLDHKSKDKCSILQKENDNLKKIIGEITLVNDVLKKTLEGGRN